MKTVMTDYKRERLTDVLFFQALPRVRFIRGQVAQAKAEGDLEMSRWLRLRLRRWEKVRDVLGCLLAEDERRRSGTAQVTVAARAPHYSCRECGTEHPFRNLRYHQERAHGRTTEKAESPPGNKGHRVSAKVLGREKSVVFTTRSAADKFAAANKHRNPTIDEVDIDPNTGKIKKGEPGGNPPQKWWTAARAKDGI
jgi:hypothetical protein